MARSTGTPGRTRLPTLVALTSRSHEPGGGGQLVVVAPIATAASRAASERRAEIATAAPARINPSATPLAAPPAPSTVARRPAIFTRRRSGSRNPSTSVLVPAHRPPVMLIVFTAPASLAI